MISLCRDATKRVIVLMYCLWKIEISCCTCLSKITAYKQIRLIKTCFGVHNCSYIHAEVFLFKFTNILLNKFILTSKWLFT